MRVTKDTRKPYRVGHKHPNGTTYIYEVFLSWNKERKQSYNKQRCIGKPDPATGELIPNRSHAERAGIVTSDKSVTASSLIVGPTLVLDAVTKELGLGKVLDKYFPETSGQMLAMAYHLVCRGEAPSHFPEWAKTHRNPSGGMLTTQRISELLAGLDEDGRQTFLAAWLRYRSESEYLCFDITKVSSYFALNEHVKYGENRDGEDLPQLNLALLFGQKSMLPVYYRELPGNISDFNSKLLTSLYDG